MTGRGLLALAWREGRASWRRFLVLVVAVAIGVGALVAIDSFTENVEASVATRARALLGADLKLQSRRDFSPRVEALLDTLAPDSSALARVTYFGGMAYVPRTAGTRPVNVTAVAGPYPLYGEIRTEPAGAWATLDRGRRVLVDPALLTALNAQVGDTLALGEARFVIAGTILNFPGDIGLSSAFSPRVAIAARYLGETELLQFGSRAQYAAYVKLASPDAADALAERYRAPLRAEHVRIRSAAGAREDLGEALARLASYLGLVALIALLLGGLGVASAVHVFIRQKLETIAVLRCLGATARQVFVVYLLQAMAIGLVGGVAGTLLGIAVQAVLPAVVGDFLPVDVAVAPSWRALLIGLATGLWVAVTFSLLPILSVRKVAPLAVLRRIEPDRAGQRDPWRWAVLAVIAATVTALAIAQAERWPAGALFAGAIALSLAALWFAAWLLMRAVRRWFPGRWPYVWRQGLANLYRPANQTVTVVLALGFGGFLLGTLLLVQYNLLRELEFADAPSRPNLVLIDVQQDQRQPVETELHQAGFPSLGSVPIVPMRILSVKGRPVRELLADTSGRDGGEGSDDWALRREYQSTYRDTLTDSEEVVLGEWWADGMGEERRTGPSFPHSAVPSPVSLEAGIAAELGVTVGDEIVWDVQGVPLATRVGSLREVDWARFEPNFFAVFEPGTLEHAPQTFVTLARVEEPAARGLLQRRLAERFPNITTLDLALIQQALERVLGRVILAIRFMALFTLATGALVLAGAVATSRFQRTREVVLLKTLGATRGQVARVVLAEYLSLGLLASITAIGLALLAGWALAHFLFGISFAVPLPPLAGLAALFVVLTVGIGVGSSLEAVRGTPVEALRE